MPLGFQQQNELLVYGDGKGNIVIEEFIETQLHNIGMVKISLDRFEFLIEQFEKLKHEAHYGSLENDDEA